MTTFLEPQLATLDYVAFFQALEVIREHKGIETVGAMADEIGIDSGVLYRLRKGEGVGFEPFIKIVAWSKLDVRKYLVNGAVVAAPGANVE